jgi:threonine synthase
MEMKGAGAGKEGPAPGGDQRERATNTLNVVFPARRAVEGLGNWARRSSATITPALDESNYRPHTIARRIEISRPVNLPKALRALEVMNGVVREVTDEEILEHRAMVARWGFGCEPASAASVAGLHKLVDEKVILVPAIRSSAS